MDLVDLIQTRRFLGSEFLTWLWYKSEVYEGRFNIGERGACEVWFDDRLTLEAVVIENEQSQLKGASPSVSPEAREALRQGKIPVQARLRLVCDQQEFAFAFKGPDFLLSGVKIPTLLSDEADEKFYERMYLIEELEAIIHDLYAEFLALRLSPAWVGTFIPWLRAWVQVGELASYEQYDAMSATIPKLTSVLRFTTKREETPDADGPQAADASNGEATSAAPESNGAATETAEAKAEASSEPESSDLGVDASGEPVLPPPPF